MPYCAKCGKKVKIFYGIWKYEESFPEFYDRLLCSSCNNELNNARIRKIAESEGEREIEALCEHLRRIGLKVTMESKERKPLNGFGGFYSNTFIGSVRVADRNIDLVELNYFVGVSLPAGENSGGYVTREYWSTFMVQAKVEGLEEKLRAEGKPVRKSFFSSQVVDFKWEGKELAQILNSDAELRSHLLSQRRLSKVEIVPFKEDHCIRISQEGGTHPPTIETFEAYDRIAQHIRSIANVRP